MPVVVPGSNTFAFIGCSLFDALRAGFRDLVFIIKPEMEAVFCKILSLAHSSSPVNGMVLGISMKPIWY